MATKAWTSKMSAVLLAGTAGVVLAPPATAQTAPQNQTQAPRKPAEQPAQEREVGEGSLVQEILVTGYRVDASTSATGIVTAIVDTPMSISAVTEKFLKDTGSTDLMDAIGSLTGVTGQGNSGEVAVNFGVRGFAVAPQVNGFSTLSIAGGLGSSSGVERIEVLKGPSAVFNGNVPPGGTINIIYKRPSFTPETYVEAIGGSWDYASAELSSRGSVAGSTKLAYLVDGYYRNNDGWVNYTGLEEKAGTVALRYQPVESLTLDVAFRRTNREVRASTLPVSHEGYIGSGAPYTFPLDAWVAANYGPLEPPQTITVPQYMPDGRRDNVLGPQNSSKSNLWLYEAGAHYKLNEHVEIRDSFMYQRFTWDILAIVQSGAKVIGADGRSSIYSSLLSGSTAGRGWENKLEAAFHFDTGPVSHDLLLGSQLARSHSERYRVYVGPPAFNAQGLPWDYHTDGPRMLADELSALRAAGAPPLIDAGRTGNVKTHAFYIAEQASIWDGRVRLVLGGRYTKTETDGLGVSDFTPQAAILFKPFPESSPLADTSLFFNYSESFTPVGLVDPNTTQIVPPSKGTGKELGIKTAWFGGKLTGTLSVFRDELRDIPTPDYSQQGQIGVPLYHLGGVGRVQGGEAEAVWTPDRSFQIAANYTYLPTAKYVEYPNVPQQVGLRFPSTPRHAANLSVRYGFTHGPLEGGYLGGWLHTQSATRGVLAGDWQYGIRIPAQTDLDLFFGYAFKRLDVRVNVKNALNRDGYVPNNAFLPQPPRSFMVTARVNL